MDGRRVLVVGSSGILAPAAAALASAGAEVVGVSRSGAGGSIPVDARDVTALSTALDGRRWSEALVYRPAVSEESLAFLRAVTPGRCVVVRTSADAGPEAVSADTLQLGWHDGVVRRWHEPEEVSDAALAVLADGVSRTLGRTRPWSDRP